MTTKAGSTVHRNVPCSLLAGLGVGILIIGAGSSSKPVFAVSDPRIVFPEGPSVIDSRLSAAFTSGDYKPVANSVMAPHSALAETKGFGSSSATVVDVIICLNHAPTASDIATIKKAGFAVGATYSHVIYGLHAVGTVANGLKTLQSLVTDNPGLGITYIQPNIVHKYTLYKSTRQIGARQSWTAFENYNAGLPLQGSPNRSICIEDTGLDGSHPDLNGGTSSGAGTKIVNWFDAELGTPTPADTNGHGSHVAGIAAGTGVSAGIATGTGYVPITIPNQFWGNIPVGSVGAVTFPNLYASNFNAAIPVDTTGFSSAATMPIEAQWYRRYPYGENTISFFDNTGTAKTFSISGSPAIVQQPFTTAATVPVNSTGTYTFNWTTVGPNNISDSLLASYDEPALLSPGASSNTSPFVLYASAPFTAIGDGYNLLTGVAPASSLVGVSIGIDPLVEGLPDSAILSGNDYISSVATQYNIGVVNMSFGDDDPSGASNDDDIENKAVDNLVDQGIVCCVAAGNGRGTTAPNIGSPGNASSAITVAALGSHNEVTDYSSYGEAGVQAKPDVAAPGGVYLGTATKPNPGNDEPILSVQTNTDANVEGFNYTAAGDADGIPFPSADTPNAPAINWTGQDVNEFQPNPYTNSYTEEEGTSMATPHVTGAVALIEQALDTPGALGGVSMSPGAEAHFIKALLEMTASQNGFAADLNPQVTIQANQRDINEGFGKINVDAALQAILQSMVAGDTLTGTLGTTATTPTDTQIAIAPQVVARNIELNAGTTYTFNLTGPATGQYQLYLFSTSYTSDGSRSNGSNGDPLNLEHSTTGLTTTQSFAYTPSVTQTAIVVVKRISGAGPFTLTTAGATATPINVTVTDSATNLPIANAIVTATDASTGTQYNAGVTNSGGIAAFSLPATASVNITATAEGYYSNTSTASAGSSASTTATVGVSLSGSHTFPSGLQLVSAPYTYSSGFSTITYPKLFVAAYYSPALLDYDITPISPANTFQAGLGYWIHPREAVSLIAQGTPVTASADTIQLGIGWNTIGDPYTSNVSLANVTVASGGTTYSFANALTKGLISVLYSYNANYNTNQTVAPYNMVTDALQPYVGYWIQANKAATLTIPNPSI